MSSVEIAASWTVIVTLSGVAGEFAKAGGHKQERSRSGVIVHAEGIPGFRAVIYRILPLITTMPVPGSEGPGPGGDELEDESLPFPQLVMKKAGSKRRTKTKTTQPRQRGRRVFLDRFFFISDRSSGHRDGSRIGWRLGRQFFLAASGNKNGAQDQNPKSDDGP